MGMKLGRWHWGKNVGWGCLRIGCWRRVFGPKRDEVTGKWRKLHNEELSDLYSLPNFVRVAKSRRMRWAGHVARMGQGREVYMVLRERDHWGDPAADGRIILRWVFRKWEGVVGTGWSWFRIGTGGGHLWVRWWTFGFQKCGEFLDSLQTQLASQEGLWSMERVRKKASKQASLYGNLQLCKGSSYYF